MQKFKSNQEIFDFIEELISVFRSQGDKETAHLFQSALHGNFTTSEIFGELEVALERVWMNKSKEYLLPYQEDISSLILIIRKAFKKANRPW